MPKPRKRLIVLAVYGLLLTSQCWGAWLFLVVVRPAYRAWVNAIPFDQEVWKADAEAYPSRRLDMVGDLRHRHRLVGMTTQEVEELLGPPSASHPEPSGELVYEYNLGDDRYTFMLGPDNAFLLLRFRGGKVIRVWQVTG